MSKAQIHIVPILRDNYCYVVEGSDKECLIIDPGQTTPVKSLIAHLGLIPKIILNTHHHADHVAGNAELKNLYGVPVIGPSAEEKMIPNMTGGVEDGDVVSEAGLTLDVIATPGHTKGHVVFHDAENTALFSGDTLFSMGCGRLLEDSAEAMFNSFLRLKSLPPETLIYCGHEYTESNGQFAASLGPESEHLAARLTEVRALRRNDLPTVPVTLAQELLTNPFLMADTAESFATLRLRKDKF